LTQNILIEDLLETVRKYEVGKIADKKGNYINQ